MNRTTENNAAFFCSTFFRSTFFRLGFFCPGFSPKIVQRQCSALSRLFSLWVVILLCAGCGPKVTLSPDFVPFKPPYIALLPVEAPSSIQRERSEYLRTLVAFGLEEKGYLLVDDELITSACSDELCEAGMRSLSERYGVTKFARLRLTSIQNFNFLAGYYTVLEGEMRLSNEHGEALYDVVHAERDSGGLLLESGQVIQAVINQIRSGNESSIDALSSKFVRNLLVKLPSAAEIATTDAVDMVAISSTEIRPFNAEAKQLCVRGTQGGTAWLVSTRTAVRAQLREVSAGAYCGVFRLSGPWSLDSGLRVELRSAFGDVARTAIAAGTEPAIRLSSAREQGRVQ